MQIPSEWFEAELNAFAEDDKLSHSNSVLLEVASQFRQGLADESRPRYKEAVLTFIRSRLHQVDETAQMAFFSFLVLAEFVEDSFEVRSALHDLLRQRAKVDGLTSNITTALLRTGRPPAAQVREEMFRLAKAEFNRQPTWSLISILATAVGKLARNAYPLPDFIDDLGRLNGPDFPRAIALRDPIWKTLTPSTDSVALLNEVGRRQPAINADHPRSSGDLHEKMERRARAIEPNVIH